MVTHKNVLIDGQVMNSPSYLVQIAEESKIKIKKKAKMPKAKPVEEAEAPTEQPKEEVKEEEK